MAALRGSATSRSTIHAPAARVYSVIADYNQHHPRVVPPEYFKRLQVEEGGIGAGTRISVTMRVMGKTQTFQHRVSEPEPGRVLVEADTDGYSVTTFTVDPGDSGDSSKLTITTDFTPRRRGLLGRIERYLTRRALTRIYDRQLPLIAAYACELHTRSRP